MERRLLLAIVLTFAVLTAYQWLVPMSQPAPATTPAPASTADTEAPVAAAAPAQAPAAAASQPPAVETLKADSAERSIVVDNGVVRAVFSNRGATLAAWELANYRAADGKPVDLVPHDVPPNQPKPFSLEAGRRIEDGARE